MPRSDSGRTWLEGPQKNDSGETTNRKGIRRGASGQKGNVDLDTEFKELIDELVKASRRLRKEAGQR